MASSVLSGTGRATAVRQARGSRAHSGPRDARRPFRLTQVRCSANDDVAAGQELSRRTLIGAAASLAAAAISPDIFAGRAQAQDVIIPSVYQDGPDQFSISVPAGWATAEGQLDAAKGYSGASGARRALAWFVPGEERQTNVTVVITNIGADFTSLGSFGTPYSFGSSLVNSMDQSYMLRAPAWAQPKDKNIQVAKLVDAVQDSNSYNVEYTVSNNSEGHKHLLSRVLMGYNGVYNRLYTITGQCPQDEWDKYQGTLKKMLSSFQPPKLANYR